jgi:hypothetical protein
MFLSVRPCLFCLHERALDGWVYGCDMFMCSRHIRCGPTCTIKKRKPSWDTACCKLPPQRPVSETGQTQQRGDLRELAL